MHFLISRCCIYGLVKFMHKNDIGFGEESEGKFTPLVKIG